MLDYTYDWLQILENIRDYVRPGGYVCLGTDFLSHGIGHPGINDRQKFQSFIGDSFEIQETRYSFCHREVAMRLVKR